MPYLKEPTNKELKPFQFIFKASEKQMGFTPNSLKTMSRIPAVLGNFTLFSGLLISNPKNNNFFTKVRLYLSNAIWSLKFLNQKNRIPFYLRNLVAFVSSNASGCRYCQAHTISEAIHNGASKKQVDEVWDFENSDAFTEKEKAALRFGFAAGCVPNAVTAKHFTDLKKYYNENQIIELGSIISLFGFLNRWNDTFATQLENEPLKNAEKVLTKNNWEKGKH